MNKRIFKGETADTGNVPFYKIGTFGSQPDAFISRELFDEYKIKYPYPTIGDLLISASGSIGRIVEYKGEDAYFQDSNIVWLKHDHRLENSFLKQFYAIVKWKGLEGSTIKRLYNKNILETEISISNPNEQRKIGSFFKLLDNTITLHQRKLDKLKQLKQGYLQQLFPQNDEKVPRVRFENFEGNWILRKLSTGMIEYTDRVFIEDDKIYKQISVKNIGEITLRGERLGSKIGRKRQAKVNLDEHPITLIFTRQTVEQGGIGFAPVETNDAIVTENMPTIDIDINVFDKQYLSALFKTMMFRKNIIIPNIEGGTAQIAIHEDDILSSELLFPSIDEQKLIGSFFKNLNHLITLNQSKLDKLKSYKQALLQKMFI